MLACAAASSTLLMMMPLMPMIYHYEYAGFTMPTILRYIYAMRRYAR